MARGPAPKISDAVILGGTVAMMGAPTVLGDHLPYLASEILFWGGISFALIYSLWRWGRWVLGPASTESSPPLADNRVGTFAGRDAIGTQNNYFTAPPPPRGPMAFPEPPRLRGGQRRPISREGPENIARHSLQGHSKPRPDVWLQDAVCFAIHGRWLGDTELAFNDGQLGLATSIAQKMRSLARDGDFLVWGIQEVGALPDIIPREFWRDHQIDTFHLIANEAPNLRTESATASARGFQYRELKANKAQVEGLWPAPSYIPLQQAARQVYEAVEDKPLGGYLTGTETERLEYLITALRVYVKLYGKSPPSQVTRPLETSVVKNLVWDIGANSLRELTHPNNVLFVDVCVKPEDLAEHISYARSLTEADLHSGRF